jgi:hypothetical protein
MKTIREVKELSTADLNEKLGAQRIILILPRNNPLENPLLRED